MVVGARQSFQFFVKNIRFLENQYSFTEIFVWDFALLN